MPMRVLSLFILCATLLASSPALAQMEPTNRQMPAKAVGMAGVGRSFAGSGAALYLNPAGLGVVQQYIFGAGYSYSGTDESGHILGLEWTDSTPNAYNLALGLGFNYVPYSDEAAQSYHAGMAYSIRASSINIHLGVGAHGMYNMHAGVHNKLEADSLPPVEGEEPELDASGFDYWAGDFGVIMDIGNKLLLGAVGYNLFRQGEEQLPRGVGGGLSFWAGQFALAFDITATFHQEMDPCFNAQVVYAAGAQIKATDRFFLRVGAQYDTMIDRDEVFGEGVHDKIWRVAGGMTIVPTHNFGIDFGYQQSPTNPDDILATVMFEIYNPFGGAPLGR